MASQKKSPEYSHRQRPMLCNKLIKGQLFRKPSIWNTCKSLYLSIFLRKECMHQINRKYFPMKLTPWNNVAEFTDSLTKKHKVKQVWSKCLQNQHTVRKWFQCHKILLFSMTDAPRGFLQILKCIRIREYWTTGNGVIPRILSLLMT